MDLTPNGGTDVIPEAEHQPTVGEAIAFLAGRCNYASSWDGAGFNKFDADFGHRLAELGENRWSVKQAHAAWRMLKKYRGQLAGAGIDYDALAEPVVEEAVTFDKFAAAQKTLRVCTLNAEMKQFSLASPYSPSLVEDIKGLPRQHRQWDGANKLWLVADEPRILEKWDFRIDDEARCHIEEVLAETAEIRDREQRLSEASKAAAADLQVEGLGGDLRPFQRAGVLYASETRRCLIGDEMGLGKTIQALAAVQHMAAYPALVLCPAVVKPNWRREARKWLLGKDVLVLNGSPKPTDPVAQDLRRLADGKAIPADLLGHAGPTLDKLVVVANYDVINQWSGILRDIRWGSLICDESHYLKNPQAQRTKFVKEMADGIETKLLLTGTAVMNRPDELVSQLQILGRLDDFGGWAKFRQDYVWGMRLRELNDRMRATCYIRRQKIDVLTELPAKQRTVVPVEIDNRAEYNRVWNDVIAWVAQRATSDAKFLERIAELDGEERAVAIKEHALEAGERAARAEALVKIGALKYTAAKGKMKAAIDWVREFLESGEKLVIFADTIEFQRKLIEAFPGCAQIMGADDAEKRQNNVDRFQNDDDCQIIVCSLGAGGVGITLTAASNVAFLELGWNPATMDQAEDRCHRLGQHDSVTAWYFIGEQTIDQDITDLIDKKREIVTAALEGKDVDHESLLGELMGRIRAEAGL